MKHKANYLDTRAILIISSDDMLAIPNSPNVCFRRKDVHDTEVEIYGKVGYSDLTGLPLIEDMRVEHMGVDVISLIPESLLQDWEDSIMEGVKAVPV